MGSTDMTLGWFVLRSFGCSESVEGLYDAGQCIVSASPRRGRTGGMVVGGGGSRAGIKSVRKKGWVNEMRLGRNS